MKNTSEIPYDALQVRGLKEVLIQVSAACQELEISFFIVGALARNVWYAANDERPRGTKDIDFAVSIPSQEDYLALKDKLQQDCGYHQSRENMYCLLAPGGIPVDLLPFGAIDEGGQVLVEGKGLSRISLEGFEEVYHYGLEQVRLGNETYAVCSIPSVLILKLIAYDDRPEHRVKDVIDIDSICTSYPSLEQEYIWSEHFDLYDGERDQQDVAMIVLGREMKKIVHWNDQLFQRLIRILEEAMEGKSRLMDHMIKDSGNETIEQKGRMLRRIAEGLMEQREA